MLRAGIILVQICLIQPVDPRDFRMSVRINRLLDARKIMHQITRAAHLRTGWFPDITRQA